MRCAHPSLHRSKGQWPALTAVSSSAFDRKKTVVFKLGNVGVDFTFCHDYHGPSIFSTYMAKAVQEQLTHIQQGVMLCRALFCASSWAYRRNRGQVGGAK